MTDLSDIHRTLAETPSLIEQAANEVATQRAALDRAKREAEKARAMATINHQNAKNQTILQALVDLDSGVGSAEAAVIEAHGAYLAAIARHERCKDDFDAAKKESNLIEAEMRSFSSQRHQ
ncbi:MAG: hypothetical protein JWP89_2588 [Schlesneria sp.]|nr:hypothetical protein [Schlesneria sp.]